MLITFQFLQSELRDIFYSSTIRHPMQPEELNHKKHSIKFKDDKMYCILKMNKENDFDLHQCEAKCGIFHIDLQLD